MDIPATASYVARVCQIDDGRIGASLLEEPPGLDEKRGRASVAAKVEASWQRKQEEIHALQRRSRGMMRLVAEHSEAMLPVLPIDIFEDTNTKPLLEPTYPTPSEATTLSPMLSPRLAKLGQPSASSCARNLPNTAAPATSRLQQVMFDLDRRGSGSVVGRCSPRQSLAAVAARHLSGSQSVGNLGDSAIRAQASCVAPSTASSAAPAADFASSLRRSASEQHVSTGFVFVPPSPGTDSLESDPAHEPRRPTTGRTERIFGSMRQRKNSIQSDLAPGSTSSHDDVVIHNKSLADWERQAADWPLDTTRQQNVKEHSEEDPMDFHGMVDTHMLRLAFDEMVENHEHERIEWLQIVQNSRTEFANTEECLERTLEEKERLRTQMEEERQASKEDKGKLRAAHTRALRGAQAASENYQEQRAEQEVQLKKLEGDLHQERRKMCELRTIRAKLEGRLKQESTELRLHMSKSLEERDSEFAELGFNYVNVLSEFEAAEERLEADHSKAIKPYSAELFAANTALSEERNALESQVAALDGARELVSLVQIEFETSQAQLTEIRESLARNESASENNATQMKQLSTELADRMESNSEMHRQVKASQREIIELRGRLLDEREAIETETNVAMECQRTLQNERESLRAVLNEECEEKSEMESQHKVAEEVLAKIQSERALRLEAQAKLEAMRVELATVRQEHVEARAAADEVRESGGHTRVKIKTVEADAAAARRQEFSLAQDIMDLQKVHTSEISQFKLEKDKMAQRFKSQREKLEKANQHLQEEATYARNSEANLKEQYKSMKEERFHEKGNMREQIGKLQRKCKQLEEARAPQNPRSDSFQSSIRKSLRSGPNHHGATGADAARAAGAQQLKLHEPCRVGCDDASDDDRYDLATLAALRERLAAAEQLREADNRWMRAELASQEVQLAHVEAHSKLEVDHLKVVLESKLEALPTEIDGEIKASIRQRMDEVSLANKDIAGNGFASTIAWCEAAFGAAAQCARSLHAARADIKLELQPTLIGDPFDQHPVRLSSPDDNLPSRYPLGYDVMHQEELCSLEEEVHRLKASSEESDKALSIAIEQRSLFFYELEALRIDNAGLEEELEAAIERAGGGAAELNQHDEEDVATRERLDLLLLRLHDLLPERNTSVRSYATANLHGIHVAADTSIVLRNGEREDGRSNRDLIAVLCDQLRAWLGQDSPLGVGDSCQQGDVEHVTVYEELGQECQALERERCVSKRLEDELRSGRARCEALAEEGVREESAAIDAERHRWQHRWQLEVSAWRSSESESMEELRAEAKRWREQAHQHQDMDRRLDGALEMLDNERARASEISRRLERATASELAMAKERETSDRELRKEVATMSEELAAVQSSAKNALQIARASSSQSRSRRIGSLPPVPEEDSATAGSVLDTFVQSPAMEAEESKLRDIFKLAEAECEALNYEQSITMLQSVLVSIREGSEGDGKSKMPVLKAEVLAYLGVSLQSLGRVDEAITAYSEAVAQDPSLHVCHANLASLYVYKEDHKRAQHHLHKALRLDPWNQSYVALTQQLDAAAAKHHGGRSEGVMVRAGIANSERTEQQSKGRAYRKLNYRSDLAEIAESYDGTEGQGNTNLGSNSSLADGPADTGRHDTYAGDEPS